MQRSRFKFLPFFQKGFRTTSGRNTLGRITVRHRGGGHKQKLRTVAWNSNSKKGIVVGFEYDPQRTTTLAKLYHADAKNISSSFSYQIATQNQKPFQVRNNLSDKITQNKDISYLRFFEAGDFVNSVELYPGKGPSIARAAGSFCQIRSNYSVSPKYRESTSSSQYIKVRLPSGSQRLISGDAKASAGVPVLNGYHQRNRIKAGRNRWYGRRPSVRGVARNPVDHPHGGGQGKTSGGRPSVTFKSWPTKGQPTRNRKRQNRFILVTAKKSKIS